jgi:TonB family protein
VKEKMNHIITSLAISCLAAVISHSALAEELDNLKLAPKVPLALASGELKQLESEPGYNPPKPIRRMPPVYPQKRLKKSQEGMVDVEFMVDENGKVFAPIVTQSTHSGFEDPALEAILKYQYKPAHIDSEIFKAATNIRITFLLDGSEDAVGQKFKSVYKRADKELNSANPDQQKLKREFARLDDAKYLNNYGLAYLSMLEYRYAIKFLSKQAQLKSLRKLLIFENRVGESRQFLDPATIKSIRMNILQLLIELGYYGEARSNFYWLNKEIPDAAKPFEGAISQVRDILNGGEAIVRSVELSDRGHEFLDLAKRSFEIDVIEGSIEKLNFYCSRNFGTMVFKPNSNYQVPKAWGRCDLLIVGEPNTKAKLYQL